MKRILVSIVLIFLWFGFVQAQQNYLITGSSAGNVRLGMTVAQARKILNGHSFDRISDGEGIALIQVTKNGKEVMRFFAGEADPDAEINEKARIEFIEVFDARYKTVSGVRPLMSVKNAEKILGRIELVFKSEIEAREFVVFRKKPKGLSFRAAVERETGKYLYAGRYPNDEREATRYVPAAYLLSIQISMSQ